ncbi:MAG TPA: NADH-quinone oxidoreductase subunit L, partial [bacterium]|nr:NADH-quinone oxidoreductase subunit L [bacterium]
FDQSVIDGAVNGTGKATLWTSKVKNWIDQTIVDGLVNFTGALTQFLSAVMRLAQTGFIQHYLLIVFVGLLVLIGLMSKS